MPMAVGEIWGTLPEKMRGGCNEHHGFARVQCRVDDAHGPSLRDPSPRYPADGRRHRLRIDERRHRGVRGLSRHHRHSVPRRPPREQRHRHGGGVRLGDGTAGGGPGGTGTRHREWPARRDVRATHRLAGAHHVRRSAGGWRRSQRHRARLQGIQRVRGVAGGRLAHLQGGQRGRGPGNPRQRRGGGAAWHRGDVATAD